jgi:hypothetical protein
MVFVPTLTFVNLLYLTIRSTPIMYISFKFPKAISKLMKCRNEPYYPSAPVHSKPYDPVPIPQKVNSRRSSSTSTEGTSDNEHSYGKRA